MNHRIVVYYISLFWTVELCSGLVQQWFCELLWFNIETGKGNGAKTAIGTVFWWLMRLEVAKNTFFGHSQDFGWQKTCFLVTHRI